MKRFFMPLVMLLLYKTHCKTEYFYFYFKIIITFYVGELIYQYHHFGPNLIIHILNRNSIE